MLIPESDKGERTTMIYGSEKTRKLDQTSAQDLATEALVFIAADQNRLVKFLNISGYRPEDIRGQVASPEFLAGVLGFLLDDESELLVFASHNNHDPALLHAARQVLSPDRYEREI
jgi:hypothetical protein